ncbi:Metallo-hydrolase/oxidoreductase [Setomelanomma holmii]|uniref:Metallo-hydrolase/oxidoreductase n=1 Tax=Setomelanomma holmii TaxID=210430 RepID=A0A9P4LH62_9PLEO|nr:Metallo-hydrolase/oxidoreductase [Setomelanomma holmii]
MMTQEPIIQSSFEERTGTWQYVVADPATKKAVIIDSVLHYNPNTLTISTDTADALLAMISENGYQIEKILETHAHADHLTAASYLQHRLHEKQGSRPQICIGRRIKQVQDLFAGKYGIPAAEYEDVFDHLFEDDESFKIGELIAKVMHLPGHTPDHIGYQIGANVFCGDSIFHADIGTARCDFPGGSAKSLYDSGRNLLALPDDVKIWTGHDYPACPERCEAVPWMTVRDHKTKNKHLSQGVEEDDFLALREERDASLAAPRLLDASLQINIRAGRLPCPTAGGYRLMHLPVRVVGEEW